MLKPVLVAAQHPAYFRLLDVPPTAITKKLDANAADATDFAGHTNPQTTRQFYDRRQMVKPQATE